MKNKAKVKTKRNLTKPCIKLSEYWTSMFFLFFHKYSYFHSLVLPAPHITYTHTHKQMELQIQPLTVDEIIVKAIKASFCMTSCSDDIMATMGASPPHFIICSATSAGDNEE